MDRRHDRTRRHRRQTDRREGGERPERFRRRRRQPVETPLNELIAEAEAGHGDGASRRKSKTDSPLSRINLSHVAFMLLGLLLGAGIFLTVSFLMKLGGEPEETTKQAAPQQAKITPAPPPKQVYQATSPVDAVRTMLQASLAGDRDTAYAQWEVGPDEAATVKSGQAVSLAEMTDQLYDARDQIRLADLDFGVRTQQADSARVLQKRGAVVLQVYSVRKHGPYWKISYASPP